MTLNKEKCTFQVESVKYLGNVITGSGVKPDPEKVKAIMDMPPPADHRGVERLIGTMNYLANFVPNMSAVIEPIKNLLRKDAEFMWSNPQEKAFNKITDVLSQQPVLKFVDVKKPIMVCCDTSNFGFGAILTQDDKPVSLASRSMTEAKT